MLPVKYQFSWISGFREQDYFFTLANQKQESPMAAMFVNRLRLNADYIKDLTNMIPAKFGFIWPSRFRGEH